MQSQGLIELVCSVFIGLTFAGQLVVRGGAVTTWRLRVLYGMTFVWLLSDGLCYLLDGSGCDPLPQYALNCAVYALTNLVAGAFFWFCDGAIRERAKLSRWTFGIPMAVMVLNAVIVSIWFASGRLITIEEGVAKVIGAPPMFVLVSYVALLFHVPVIAFLKRRDVGLRMVSLLVFYCVPLAGSLVILVTTNIDISVLMGGVSVFFVASYLQRDIIEAGRRAEQEVRQLVTRLVDDCNLAYLIDLSTEALKIVRMDDHMAEKGQDFRTFEDQRRYFLGKVVHPRSREKLRRELETRTIREKLAKAPSYKVEYAVLKQGVTYWGEMTVTAIGPDRIVLGMVQSDIELIKRHVEEQRYNEYFAIFLVDVDTQVLRVVRKSPWDDMWPEGAVEPYREVIGSIGERCADRTSGDAVEFYRSLSEIENVRKLLASEGKFTYSYRSAFLTDGKWVTMTGTVFEKRPDGSPAAFSLAYNIVDPLESDNLDSQAKVREALAIAEIANQRTETLHKIVKSAPWSVMFNARREITRCEFSPELAQVLRNDIENSESWAAAIHPEDREQATAKPLAALNAKTGNATFDSEYRILSRDGQYHWVRSAGRVIPNHIDGGGELYGMCMDIDESVKRREEERKQLEEMRATERANKAKSYFFSMVSHDIRTPLNAIIGYAELLKLGIADEVERRKAVDSVLVSGHTLLELINDVLDLSKLEAGKMEILPEPVDVKRLVEEVADAFRATIGGKPVEIRSEVEAMPWLKLDPHRVRQILFNLVGNAVKFTDTGYVAISAAYERSSEEDASGVPRGTFQFAVADTGCGISEEDQRRVAQPYVQVGLESSRGKGTGLGLAICKQLVLRMGGEMRLDSQLGKGTTFTVAIPDVEEDADTLRKRLSTTQRITLAVEEHPVSYKHVLVVDDVAMNRVVLKTMLRKFGITEVEMADNGFSALKKLGEAGPFDLVLTDMWMPGMDGERLVREIRKNPDWAKLPVYAVTADVEAQNSCAGMGFSGVLLKPLTFEKLKEFFRQNAGGSGRAN